MQSIMSMSMSATRARGGVSGPGTEPEPEPTAGVIISWTDNATNETGYRVDRSADNGVTWPVSYTAPAAEGSGLTVSRTITGLPFNVSFAWRVIAVNGVLESAALGPVSAWTSPPASPSGLTGTATGPDGILWQWTNPAVMPASGGIKLRYRVAGSGGAWTTVEITDGATSFETTGLTDAETYAAEIVSYNDNGAQPDAESAPAATASATTDTAPTFLSIVDALGPQNHWRFGEPSGLVASDRKGNAHGSYSAAGVIYGTAGAIDDDPNTGITLNSDASGAITLGTFTPGSGAMTVILWAKPGTTTTRFILSSRTSTSTSQGFELLTNGALGAVDLRFRDPTTLHTVPGTAGNPAAWTMFAVVFTGSAGRLYRDGALVGEQPYTGGIGSAAALKIGLRSSTPWGGDVDEAMIFPRALTLSEIIQIRDAAKPSP